MKETSPLALYVHCYGHLLNLAIQDTVEEVEPLRKALGTIQGLYNFQEVSPKRHAIFNDKNVVEDHLRLTLKSLSVTRRSCRWEAVKAVIEQQERIVKTLLKMSVDKNAKTCANAWCLLTSICDFEFVFRLYVLKVILCSTSDLSRYLQGKSIDVISAKRAADLATQTLRTCRTDEAFEQVWALTDSMSERFKELIKDWPRFSFRDATAPRARQVSRRLMSLAGEAAEEPSVLRTAADHHQINTYFRSLDQVVAELESRFARNDQDVLCVLGNVVAAKLPAGG
jgi:hypothetical protein